MDWTARSSRRSIGLCREMSNTDLRTDFIYAPTWVIFSKAGDDGGRTNDQQGYDLR